jgi:hypothetical protein
LNRVTKSTPFSASRVRVRRLQGNKIRNQYFFSRYKTIKSLGSCYVWHCTFVMVVGRMMIESASETEGSGSRCKIYWENISMLCSKFT